MRPLVSQLLAKHLITFIYLTLMATPLLFGGCYAPMIEGAQQGYDATKRVQFKNEIKTDDPEKQYQLGNTYCCKGSGPLKDLSIYDNNKATYWYCKAARQGYGPAQIQLAKLYFGHAIRGLHVFLRASSAIGDPDTDLSLALMWAKRASLNKHDVDIEDALELRNEITKKVTEQELAKTEVLLSNWQNVACEWSEVFPVININ